MKVRSARMVLCIKNCSTLLVVHCDASLRYETLNLCFTTACFGLNPIAIDASQSDIKVGLGQSQSYKN